VFGQHRFTGSNISVPCRITADFGLWL